MPSRASEDPGAQIEAILRDATSRILTVLTEQLEVELASLKSSLDPGARPPRAGKAARKSGTASPNEKGRLHTRDVAESLRQVLRSHRGGLRVGEIREATGFGNMQIHRGLELLIQEGAATREGTLRKTTYRLVSNEAPRKRREPAPKTPESAIAPRAKAPRRTPSAEVAQAVLRSLRGRKQGMGMTELRETTGHTRAQIHRALAILLNEGRLRRTGAPPALRYHLRR